MSRILFGQLAQDKLLKGINTLNDAVSSTLGPRGRNVGIDKGFEKIILHDGVSVAKAVQPTDKFENFGVSVVREAAQKTVDEVGDSTTCTVILATAIINECLKITSAGTNPMELRKGLEDGRDLLLKEIDKYSKPIKTLEEKIQVATISAEDSKLGATIGQILHDVGTDGVVTIEESKSSETTVEHQEGMQFDKGYCSPYFITDPDRMEATIEDTYVLIADKPITNIQELVPFFEKFQHVSTKLLVIAPEVTDSALNTLVLNKMRGTAMLLAVQAPSFGDKQKLLLQDIAILTGATVITGDAGMRFENIETTMLGTCDRVTSTKTATLIVGGRGSPVLIAERISSIKEQLKTEESGFEAEKLKERLAKLSSGVAVIKVGGDTEIEMKERKERAMDSVLATKAAIDEGIVAGGEIIYLAIRKILEDKTDPASGILYRALLKPFYKLVENAGYDPGETLAKLPENIAKEFEYYSDLEILNAAKTAEDNRKMGFDVTDGQFKDMIKSGIVDPTKVIKCALKNSISVAIALMTTNCVIVPNTEEKK